ncbi:hypothetical protein EC988_005733, partial [Linderina pennispora]
MPNHSDISNVNYDEIYGDHASNIYSLYASASARLQAISASSSASVASSSAIAAALAARSTQIIQFPQVIQATQTTVLTVAGSPTATITQAQATATRALASISQVTPFMDLPLVYSQPNLLQQMEADLQSMQMAPPMATQSQMVNQGASGGISVVSIIPGTAFVAAVPATPTTAPAAAPATIPSGGTLATNMFIQKPTASQPLRLAPTTASQKLKLNDAQNVHDDEQFQFPAQPKFDLDITSFNTEDPASLPFTATA